MIVDSPFSFQFHLLTTTGALIKLCRAAAQAASLSGHFVKVTSSWQCTQLCIAHFMGLPPPLSTVYISKKSWKTFPCFSPLFRFCVSYWRRSLWGYCPCIYEHILVTKHSQPYLSLVQIRQRKPNKVIKACTDLHNPVLIAESFGCVWPSPGWEYTCLNTAVQQRLISLQFQLTLFCLFHRYAKKNFTKNPDKYLKHSPDDLERTLRSFFDGGV